MSVADLIHKGASQIRYVAFFWYLSTGSDGDFMATVYQETDGTWEALFRNRDFKTGKVDDHLYGDSKTDRKKLEDGFDMAFKGMAALGKKKFEKIKIEGDFEEFIRVMSKHSWFDWIAKS